MRLLTFRESSAAPLRLGISTEQGVLDVAAAAASLWPDEVAPTTVADVLAGGDAARQMLSALEIRVQTVEPGPWLRDESSLVFGPCVPQPGKIICVGLNYRRHAAETGKAVPTTPVLFSKFSSALAGHGETVPLPRLAERYDYEVELAVVIGRPARHVSEAVALEYVFGYCTANDISARDLQNRTSQWLLGKTPDKFLPLGPYLVTADEIGDPQQLGLRTWVNGELRQDSSTADMIFSVAHIVSYLSRYLTLEPGDIISTGTPEGVIDGMQDKVWLKPGDEVAVEVEKLGLLRNVMGAE